MLSQAERPAPSTRRRLYPAQAALRKRILSEIPPDLPQEEKDRLFNAKWKSHFVALAHEKLRQNSDEVTLLVALVSKAIVRMAKKELKAEQEGGRDNAKP
jgi:hypothetical protein